MIINDKRENDDMLPIEDITNGTCFLHNNILYLKTNTPAWIEPYKNLSCIASSCICVRLDAGKLTRLNKQIKVTPINVECNMLNQNQLKAKEDLAKHITDEKLKEKNPTLKDKNVPEAIKEIFPDWEAIPENEWSNHGLIFKTADDTCIEIGLYREPNIDLIYGGTLTLRIYENNKVILSKRVSK